MKILYVRNEKYKQERKRVNYSFKCFKIQRVLKKIIFFSFK